MTAQRDSQCSPRAVGRRIFMAASGLLLLTTSSQVALAQLPPAGGGGSARCQSSGLSGTVIDPSTGGNRLGGLGRTACTTWAPCLVGESTATGEAWASLGSQTSLAHVQGAAQIPENCGLTQVVLNANAVYSVSIASVQDPPGSWQGGPVPLIVEGHLQAVANSDAGTGSSATLTIAGPGLNETWLASSSGPQELFIEAEVGMTFDGVYSVGVVANCIAGVGFSGGLATCAATADPTFEFDQATFDATMGDDTFPLADYFAIEYSENLAGTPLGLDVVKLTNFNRADGPYDNNVPRVTAGETVTWTYEVANTGDTAIAATDLLVTDSDPAVIPILDVATDDGDLVLSSLETWHYTATAPALDLATPPAEVTVVTGCGDGRNTYANTGRAEIANTGIFDEHVGYYCNDVPVPDSDGDGIRDEQDNCIEVENGPVVTDAGGLSQRDTDGDGYGNVCDPDLDNNGVVNFVDVSLWVPFFNTATTGVADFNGDGTATFVDYALFPEYVFGPPGPSGIVP